MKASVSRNKREGYYAGYYPLSFMNNKAGHRRWDWFAMGEFYPRIYGTKWMENI